MNDKFGKISGTALNNVKDVTLEEVESYGYCMYGETFIIETGNEIKIIIYELDSKTYLIKYVDNTCIQFTDISPMNK